MTTTYPNGLSADASFEIERPCVPALDAILGHAFDALDHGFVRVIDYMGDDAAVVQMARVSYGAGTETPSSDEHLIRYLMRHWHTSPFEGCEIKLHVKLPIFVARQWIRHRTANVNEYSGRYSIMSDKFYVPAGSVLAPQSKSNKQGREGGYSDSDKAVLTRCLTDTMQEAHDAYRGMIEVDGYDLARELARTVLPLSTYTEFYWKIDLHNLLHFLRLRADSHAQYEIRAYADIIQALVEMWTPATYRAWVDYRRDAVTFSRMEMAALRKIIDRIAPAALRQELDRLSTDTSMSDRERREFIARIES